MRFYMLMALFRSAFDEFLALEINNILADISERNLCGRLMLYMDTARTNFGLDQYFVHTEYNRNLGDLKRIRHNPFDDADIITCDLILHSRGRLTEDNLIAIEMKKKKHSRISKDEDRDRLIALTRPAVAALNLSIEPDHVFGYQLGLFIILDTKRASHIVEIYRAGEDWRNSVLVVQKKGPAKDKHRNKDRSKYREPSPGIEIETRTLKAQLVVGHDTALH